MDQKKYKVVVVSDSHGTSNLVSEIERWNPDADLYVHCGDLEDNPALFDNWLFARGNNDFFSAGNMKEQQVIRVGEHRLLVVHSHRCSYMNREMDLVRMAQENDCDIVCFGHTHCSMIKRVHGVLLVNPGSTWSPRDGKEPSYAVLTLEGPQAEAELVFESQWVSSKEKPPVQKKRFFRF